MLVPLPYLVFAASIISSNPLANALLSPSNISPDLPVASLLSEANAHLAKGETTDAITYYDVAISRDPKNYLTLFKRGATYLSLGRTIQALSDFDAVLEIKNDFEGALVQRAKIMSSFGDWENARKNYEAAGHAGNSLAEIDEAEGAAKLAADAEKKKDYEGCISHAGAAIMVANRNLALRQLRARCRFERGEMQEGISDLVHVLHIQPGLTDPHLQISSIQFFSLADTERGMAQIRKCLISDPDSKSCKKLHRIEKQIDKALKKVRKLLEKRSYSTAAKQIVGSGEETGLMQGIKEEFNELHDSGVLPAKAKNELYTQVVEMACEAHIEMKSKKAPTYCSEALEADSNSLHGLLWKAQQSFDAENFEACIHTLNVANEHHAGNAKIQTKLNEAQKALRQSKQKDYYKVLGVSRDADELQIKAAYRKKTREHHPDKAVRLGVTKEDAEKKMASINEAYEVLSDPELKERFDRGDDPNSHEPQHQFHQGGGFPFGGHQQFRQSGGRGGSQQFHFKFPNGGGFPGGGGFPFG